MAGHPFRCSRASAADGEPLAGTAPAARTWLLVERPGGWEPTVDLVHDDPGVRVQLIRRPGRTGPPTRGGRVFWAARGEGPGLTVRAGVLADPTDAGAVAGVDPADLTPYDGPLWLVCAHGRRDVCCAEQGRPVAAALAARWPDATWETTHLGGHRFAATLLALPSGLVLGRLDAARAVSACAEIAAGGWPADVVRGRAGTPTRDQVAEAHLRSERGLNGLADVSADVSADAVGPTPDERVRLVTPTGPVEVRVRAGEPVARRQSCAEERLKPAPSWHCETC